MSLQNGFQQLRDNLQKTIIGQPQLVERLLLTLLADGHLLVEGAPGLAKTKAINALADRMEGEFKRVQFTPDLLPGDITGTEIYRPQEGTFHFQRGPIFHNLLLADEINRASPRTQSALLESMNERQVSIDGETKQLPDPFLVVATQNDTSSTGTFPLPEPQLDRFLLSIPMALPPETCQLDILKLHGNGTLSQEASPCVLPLEDLITLQKEVTGLSISENLQRYLLALCQAARSLTGQDHAVSVRGTLALQAAARAFALLEGQPAVHPDHVQAVFPHVLRHRLLTEDTLDPDPILNTALDQTPVP